jgi:hypothetical protein
MRGLDGALRLQKGCVSQPAGDRKPSIMSCRDSPKMARSFRDGPGRNFDPLPHAPGFSPYVSTGYLSAGAHERRRAAHVYVWPIMSDELPRACCMSASTAWNIETSSNGPIMRDERRMLRDMPAPASNDGM